MEKNNLIGSIFLVTGTTVGAGMIALPVTTGTYGFAATLFMFITVWLASLVIAFAMLEANLQHKEGANLITMISATLGRPGEIIGWGSCLLFLYCILAAYLSGLGELTGYSLSYILPLDVNKTTSVVVITAIASGLIYSGIRMSENINRVFVIGILLIFISLTFISLPYVAADRLEITTFNPPFSSLPVIFASFGYLVIVPTLRSYLHSDVRKIKIACVVGSLIPLIMYILWATIVIGVIPVNGDNGIESILHSGDPSTGILRAMAEFTDNSNVVLIFKAFFFLAIATSLIGVSLGTFDLILDGLQANNIKPGKFTLTLLTFAPPALIVILLDTLFLTALGYAAIFSAVVFGIIPAVLPWAGRNKGIKSSYQLPGGKIVFTLIIIFSIAVIVAELYSMNNA